MHTVLTVTVTVAHPTVAFFCNRVRMGHRYEDRWNLTGWEKGPRMIGMFHVRGLDIGNLTLRDGARWHVHPVWCERVRIYDLHVFSPREHDGHPLGGNDGIDPDSCSDVDIERVYVAPPPFV